MGNGRGARCGATQPSPRVGVSCSLAHSPTHSTRRPATVPCQHSSAATWKCTRVHQLAFGLHALGSSGGLLKAKTASAVTTAGVPSTEDHVHVLVSSFKSGKRFSFHAHFRISTLRALPSARVCAPPVTLKLQNKLSNADSLFYKGTAKWKIVLYFKN